MEDYLICPICSCKSKNLISHIRRTHDKNIKNRVDFENRFPELKGTKLQISRYDLSKEFKCEFCGKIYHRLNDLRNHIRQNHPDKYFKTIPNLKAPQQKCPICSKLVGNLRQHVKESHDLEWEVFCKEYNWDVNKAKIITDEYRKKLSENKKLYYRSPEGLKRRKKQSDFWKENNPVYNPKCLEKSMFTRSSNGHLPVRNQDCRGIKVNCFGKTFRSFTEFKFYILCKKYGLNIRYEPNDYCVKWYSEDKKFYTTYLPDFIINENELIELKQDKYQVKKCVNFEKYIKVSEAYKKLNVNFKIVDPIEFFKERGVILDFEDKQYIKDNILNLYDKNAIRIITPYKESSELRDLFETDNLSNISCITFTKNAKKS